MAATLREHFDLRTICDALGPVKYNWFVIGVQLGISKNKLKEFGKEEDPLSEVIDCWLKGNTQGAVPVAWQSIVEALKSQHVDESGLANELDQKYCQKEDKNKEESKVTSKLENDDLPLQVVSDDKELTPVKEAKHFLVLKDPLTPDELDRLSVKLINESKQIKRKFAILVANTATALENANTKIKNMKLLLMSMGLEDVSKDISESCDVLDVMMKIEEENFWSFFNYELLETIIKAYCRTNKQIIKDLEDYMVEFKEYCQRRTYEVPADNFDNDFSQHQYVKVKMDDVFHVRLCDIKIMQDKISKILGTELSLCEVNDGCIELTFRFFRKFEDIFPVCEKRELALAVIGVKWVISGEYRLNILHLLPEFQPFFLPIRKNIHCLSLTASIESTESSDFSVSKKSDCTDQKFGFVALQTTFSWHEQNASRLKENKQINRDEIEITNMVMKAYGCIFLFESMSIFDEAIKRCEQCGLNWKKAAIYCELFKIHAYRQQNLSQALNAATNAILADPDYGAGYSCRAQILLHEAYINNFAVGHQQYSRCIEDFKTSFRLSSPRVYIELYRAVIVAINQGFTNLLCLDKAISRDECTELLQFIVSNNEDLIWECVHMKYLIEKSDIPGSGLATTLSCDLSNLKWDLLFQKSDIDLDLIKCIVALNKKITLHDIEIIVQSISERKLSILKFAKEFYSQDQGDIMPIFHNALDNMKFIFADELMTMIEFFTDDLMKLIQQALLLKEYELLTEILQCLSSVSSGDFVQLIENALKQKKFDFMVSLMLQGAIVHPAEIVEKMNKTDIAADSKIKYYLALLPEGRIQIFYRALRYGEYKVAEFQFMRGTRETNTTRIDMNKVLLSPMIGNAEERQEFIALIEKLIKYGINPNGLSQESPLDIVLNISRDYQREKVKLLSLLIQSGVPIGECIYQKTNQTTLIHIATKFAIESGDLDAVDLLELVCSHYPYHDNEKLQNEKGDTPYHLVMERRRSPNTIKICEILSKYPINPTLPNNHGKKPGEGRSRDQQDKRYHIMQGAAKNFVLRKKSVTSKIDVEKTAAIKVPPSQFSPQREIPQQAILPSSEQSEVSIAVVWNEIEEMLSELSNKPSSYFQPVALSKNALRSEDKPETIDRKITCESEKPTIPNIGDVSDLRDCFWEIEFKAEVKKFFSFISTQLKLAVINEIKELAKGNRKNSKRLMDGVFESNLQDYDFLILYCIDISFSSNLTQIMGNNKKFVDTIRLMDIIGNKNKDQVMAQIFQSRQRSIHASQVFPLKSCDNASFASQEILPKVYELIEGSDSHNKFLPAASTKKDDYSVVPLYCFDTAFVTSMFREKCFERVNFPVKLWPEEHDIVNLPHHTVSTLLLGRSGTGKTTCCLSRLWKQFVQYWQEARRSGPTIEPQPLPCLREKKDPSLVSSRAQLEHLHQIFITKNSLLCGLMKKKFYDLAAGIEIAEGHMLHENSELPNSLAEVKDQAFPLFLTAREFFVLLDNSLPSGKPFFSRDSEGKVAEQIISPDFNHGDLDILLDPEDSTEVRTSKSSTGLKVEANTKGTLQRREITASYFAETIWPKIFNKVSSQEVKLDPYLVWMEIKSFIKGSFDAVEKESGYLDRSEYETLGRKLAPNYESKRHVIYDLFKCYKDYRLGEEVFDECDLSHSIFRRLNDCEELPWSIHSIYVDEVQDFTQAELAILTHICRDPNDLFLTGDTAQSIMKGISFRFKDLKTIFHHTASKSKTVKIEIPKVRVLKHNYRSHTGVLNLAASVIDLMKEYFSNSYDHDLPRDTGVFAGPKPIILDSCNINDLALLLRMNKRETSQIEFGAHQVIIVQSEEARKSIPDVLQAGIVLTVFESKGLEFDDVLLYNFFEDSKVKKEWRVVTSYLEENCDLMKNDDSVYRGKCRRLEFDDTQHKLLNSELKYLYTAITRAKCNLWIYDSNKEKRLPMFDYWTARDLVKMVQIDDITAENQSTLFTVKSSVNEWKSQGDYFKGKRLWEPAMKCYQVANCPHLEFETKAYSFAQQAHTLDLKERNKINDIYLQAAHAFLKSSQSNYDYQCLENAAKCLKNARKYTASSDLYSYLGQIENAIKGYRRTNDTNSLVKLKDTLGDYSGVIRLLLKTNRNVDAIKYAAKCEAKGVSTLKCHKVYFLANQHAGELLKARSRSKEFFEEFELVMSFLPPTDQVVYFKAVNMHEEACKILMKENKLQEMYRIYRGQGWYEEGMQLARKENDIDDEVAFLVYKANEEFNREGKLMDATLNMLEAKAYLKTEIAAKANLFLGAVTENHNIIRAALDFFSTSRNLVGSIVAFDMFCITYHTNSGDSETTKDLELLLLHACANAESLVATLTETGELSVAQRENINQIEKFYGLEKNQHLQVYYFPFSSFPWTNKFLEGLENPPKKRDLDGMIQLEIDYVMKEVCKHLQQFIKRWVAEDKFKIVYQFCRVLHELDIHQVMLSGGHLSKLIMQGTQEYPAMLSTAFDFAHYGSAQIDKVSIVKATSNTLSPQATCYLPHLPLVIRSDWLSKELNQECIDVFSKNDTEFDFNEWLQIWRIKCVTGEGLFEMNKALIQHQIQRQNQDSLSVVYIKVKNTYTHIVRLWLDACSSFKQRRIFAFCTAAAHNTIRHISTLRNPLSISNLLNLLIIPSVAALSMFAAFSSYYAGNHEHNLYIPSSYNRVIQVFSSMNGMHGCDFFRLCATDITDGSRMSDYSVIPFKLQNILTIILEVMIGMRNLACNPLKDALTQEDCLHNHEAEHCLVFVMILYGNLGLKFYDDSKLKTYRLQIYNSVKHCTKPTLKEAFDRFATCATIVGSFGASNRLLEASADSLCSIGIYCNQKKIEINTSSAQLMKIAQRRLLPIDVESKSSVVLRPSAKPFVPSATLLQSLGVSSDSVPSMDFEADIDVVEASETAEKQIEHHPMVDRRFCSVCLLPLKPDALESAENSFLGHCLSKRHLDGLQLYNDFEKMEKGIYIKNEEVLYKLLSKSKSLKSFVIMNELGDVEKELSECKQELTAIKSRAAWGNGIVLLRDQISVKLNLLQTKISKLIEDGEKKRQEIEVEKEEQKNQEEAEEWDEDEYQDESDEEIAPLSKNTK